MAMKIECRHCGYYRRNISQLDDTGECQRIGRDEPIPTTADSFCPYFKDIMDIVRGRFESLRRLEGGTGAGREKKNFLEF